MPGSSDGALPALGKAAVTEQYCTEDHRPPPPLPFDASSPLAEIRQPPTAPSGATSKQRLMDQHHPKGHFAVWPAAPPTTRPGGSANRTRQQRYVAKPPGPQGTDAPGGGTTPKPQLMKQMEDCMNLGFAAVSHCTDSHAVITLRARVCFDVLLLFVGQFKAYRPVLSQVLQEFDTLLGRYDAQHKELNDTRDTVAAMTTRGEELQANAEIERNALQGTINELQTTVDAYGAENYREANHHLGRLLTHTQQELRRQKESNMLATSRLKELEFTLRHLRDMEESAATLTDHNRQLQAKVSKDEEELAKWTSAQEVATLEHDVERKHWEEERHTLVQDRNKWQAQAKEQTENSNYLLKDLRTTKQQLNRMEKELGDVRYAEQSLKDQTRALTPRPELSFFRALDGVPTKVEPTSESTVHIVEAIQNTMQQWAVHTRELRGLYDNASNLLDTQSDGSRATTRDGDVVPRSRYFIARGTGPSVPACLRASGRVRNRQLTRRDLETTLREFWVMRTKTWHGERDTPFEDTLYHYLKIKHGMESIVVEWGYSVFDAIQLYKDDPECQLFWKILTKQAPEETYHELVEVVSRLRQWMVKVDHANDNPTGKIPKRRLHQQLPKLFPSFSDDELRQMRAALEIDFPNQTVDIRHMFDESKAQANVFLGRVRELFMESVEEYIVDLKQGLQRHTDSKTGTLPLQGVREALQEVDPNQPEDNFLKFIVQCMTQMSASYDGLTVEAIDWTEVVNAELFCAQFHIVYITRAPRPSGAGGMKGGASPGRRKFPLAHKRP